MLIRGDIKDKSARARRFRYTAYYIIMQSSAAINYYTLVYNGETIRRKLGESLYGILVYTRHYVQCDTSCERYLYIHTYIIQLLQYVVVCLLFSLSHVTKRACQVYFNAAMTEGILYIYKKARRTCDDDDGGSSYSRRRVKQ